MSLTRTLLGLADTVLSLYSFCLLIYVVISWVRPPANRFTEIIRRIVEPVLNPIRNFLFSHLGSNRSGMHIDLSPIVVWFLISIIRRLLYWMI